MTVHEWGVEYEYLLTCLCDKLDMAKQKSFLSFSLDAHKASVNTSVMSKRKGKERRGRKDQSYREVLSSKADEDREGRVAAYHRSTLTFISSLLNALYRLVVDTGRDRATYLKEAFVSPPINPPRRDFDNRENEAHQQQDPLLALHFKSSSDSTRPSASPLPSTVPLSLRLHSSYCRGDSQFEQLLQCGSLLSLWRRVPPTSIHPIHRKLMHPAAIPPLW
eukprot:GHVN01010693.1.p1 GENE.GHVN01010693.1~~GHVN01010693.1.p1  ORF type:complete len:234 (+),score=49.33 GHVN01010693.1:45-704(+)